MITVITNIIITGFIYVYSRIVPKRRVSQSYHFLRCGLWRQLEPIPADSGCKAGQVVLRLIAQLTVVQVFRALYIYINNVYVCTWVCTLHKWFSKEQYSEGVLRFCPLWHPKRLHIVVFVRVGRSNDGPLWNLLDYLEQWANRNYVKTLVES